MKTRIVVLAAALAMVVGISGCGDDTEGVDGGTAYALAAGTFNVSNAVAAGTDQCGLIGAYQDPTKQIGITDNGTGLLTFNLSNDPAAAAVTLPTAILDGNTLSQPVAANYTISYGDSCVVRVNRTVTGNLVADNTLALTLTFDVATDSGSCDGDNTDFAAVPCASTYTFTATRAQ